MFSVHIPFSIRHFTAVTKFLLSAALLLLPGFIADAQVRGPLASFTEKVRTSRIDFTYSYTASSLRGSGKASVQKDCFLLTMRNFEIYCDGSGILAASAKVKDGTVTDFTFPSFKPSAVSDISDFRLSESSFPGDYIVTDLR